MLVLVGLLEFMLEIILQETVKMVVILNFIPILIVQVFF